MGDILIIETDEFIDYHRLGGLSEALKEMGIEKAIILPPKISLGNLAIERIEEIHKAIHEALDLAK